MNQNEEVNLTGVLKAGRSLIDTFLDLLYPPLCRHCKIKLERHDGRNFCQQCWNSIQLIAEPTCPICGYPLENYPAKVQKCYQCPPDKVHYDRAASVTRYDEVMREAIHWFKYRYKKGLKESLSDFMLQGLEDYYRPEHFDAVVPVPLHRRRQKQREFNQAHLLSAPVAEKLQVPLEHAALARIRYTRPQSQLKALHKAANIAGAFKVRREEAVRDKCLLLIDDLYTTGSTVNECARVLKESGAKRVCVLTLARAG